MSEDLVRLTSTALSTMTKSQARRCADHIRGNLANARRLALELHDRQGWKTLGYSSWEECAEKEFKWGHTRCYEVIQEAKIEREITQNESGVPDSRKRLSGRTLLALAPVPEGKREEVMEEAEKLAAEIKAPVTEEVVKAVRVDFIEAEIVEAPVYIPPEEDGHWIRFRVDDEAWHLLLTKSKKAKMSPEGFLLCLLRQYDYPVQQEVPKPKVTGPAPKSKWATAEGLLPRRGVND